MKLLRRLYFRLFPHYRVIESRCAPYDTADRVIRESENKPEAERWTVYPEMEDRNRVIGLVFICRRERIIE